ncbi:unnamed protein product [Linum tenue]|uniref:Uncharacterized protein n=1 Tax=Linum tenue TaxID=586396 RepID=A0AAV0MPW0_9ROSI|nr:unnamed protein product [Linum tenue]
MILMMCKLSLQARIEKRDARLDICGISCCKLRKNLDGDLKKEKDPLTRKNV